MQTAVVKFASDFCVFREEIFTNTILSSSSPAVNS
jgi:hypothetical protein